VELYDAARTGNWGRAGELQAKLLAVRAAVTAGPYLSGMKGALRLLGHDMGVPRLPMVGMSSEQEEALRQQLRTLSVQS